MVSQSPTSVTVAVDAMGGDHAPEEIVRGVADLSLEAPHIQTVLVGDSAVVTTHLSRLRHNPERISVHHTAGWVPMGGRASEVLRSRTDTSIAVAARLVADGAADALVSAGHTGASVLACAEAWRKIPGVR